jgi:uncharacterized protein YjbI with pentapeptide repeats
MRSTPIVTRVIHRRTWPALATLVTLWTLSTLALSQAGRITAGEVVYLAAQLVQYVFFVVVLLVPLGVTVFAAFRTFETTREPSAFELLRVSALSDRAIALGYAVTSAYRLRWWLVLVLGVLPVLAVELAEIPAIFRLTRPSIELGQPLSTGAVFTSIPWLIWELGLVLLAATLGTMLGLRWKRLAGPAIAALFTAGVALDIWRMWRDALTGWSWFYWGLFYLEYLRQVGACHFGLRCLLGLHASSTATAFLLLIAAPYLMTLLIVRIPWPRDGRVIPGRRIVLEILALSVLVVILPWGVDGLREPLRAHKAGLLDQAVGNHVLALDAVERLRAGGWLTDGSLRNVLFGDQCFVPPCGTSKSLDLSGADLSGAALEAAHSAYADLRGANLANANLPSADFFTSDLRGATMQRANLRGADLNAANLENADLRGADLRGAYLEWTNLRSANLTGSWLDPTTSLPDTSHWNPASDLERFTDPQHPQFWRGYEFDRLGDDPETDWVAVEFDGANLAGSISLHMDKPLDLRRASFRGADLSYAIWQAPVLENADLAGANLYRAYLAGARLKGADLRGANLESAYWYGADFRGVGVFDCDQFRRAASLSGAILPDGTVLPSSLPLEWWQWRFNAHSAALFTPGGTALAKDNAWLAALDAWCAWQPATFP